MHFHSFCRHPSPIIPLCLYCMWMSKSFVFHRTNRENNIRELKLNLNLKINQAYSLVWLFRNGSSNTTHIQSKVKYKIHFHSDSFSPYYTIFLHNIKLGVKFDNDKWKWKWSWVLMGRGSVRNTRDYDVLTYLIFYCNSCSCEMLSMLMLSMLMLFPGNATNAFLIALSWDWCMQLKKITFFFRLEWEWSGGGSLMLSVQQSAP